MYNRLDFKIKRVPEILFFFWTMQKRYHSRYYAMEYNICSKLVLFIPSKEVAKRNKLVWNNWNRPTHTVSPLLVIFSWDCKVKPKCKAHSYVTFLTFSSCWNHQKQGTWEFFSISSNTEGFIFFKLNMIDLMLEKKYLSFFAFFLFCYKNLKTRSNIAH